MSSTASSSATLGNTPLLHLLVSITDRQMSGTVSFETPEGATGAIVFDRGRPRKSLANAPRCRLSDLLIEFGWLDAPSAEQTYAMAVAQQELHGQVLMECQLVDAAGLSRVLEHQLLRKLNWLATRAPETTLGVHEGIDLLAQLPDSPCAVSSLAMLWALAKCHIDERSKQKLIELVGHRPLQLHRSSEPELFGLNDAEMSLVDRLRHVKMDMDALLYQLELPRQTAEALLYLLLLTRHIDLGDSRVPVGVTPKPVTSLPPRSSGEYRKSHDGQANGSVSRVPSAEPFDSLAQLRHDLQSLAARAPTLDHYALLGVARDASQATLRTAFTALASRYHPDRLPAPLQDLRITAIDLTKRLMVAYRTLADVEQRDTYNSTTPPPSSNAARARVQRRNQCAEALRRAEQMLNRNRLDLAEAECARAIELDPADPRCLALHAWIRSLRPDAQAELAQLLESLTKALDLDPMNVQTRYYRSELLKRLDRLDEAVGEWRLIIDLSPNHIDAQRELRLWEMRRGSSRPPKQSRSGTHRQVSLIPPALDLLGKLFRGPR